MFDSFESTVGERIRYYRKRAGMTQKELAEKCGISEPAIRNYELDNRIPGFETLEDIASALQVDFYALADTNISALAGVMQCFFRMEYAHALRPVEANGQTVLAIDLSLPGKQNDLLQKMLDKWLEARRAYDAGVWTEEQYEDWQSRYPFGWGNANSGEGKTGKHKHPRKRKKQQ